MLCKIYYGTIRSRYQLHAHRVVVDVLMPWSPFFILIRQRASCQEFALCILLITWSSFDLTQVWQGQDSIWRHGTNIQDVSWEFQFKCCYTSGVSIDKLIPFKFESSRINLGLKPPWPGVWLFGVLRRCWRNNEAYASIQIQSGKAGPLGLHTRKSKHVQLHGSQPICWVCVSMDEKNSVVFLLWHFDIKKMAHRICKTNPQFQK